MDWSTIDSGTKLVFVMDGLMGRYPYAVKGKVVTVRSVVYNEDDEIEGVILEEDPIGDKNPWDMHYFKICKYTNAILKSGGNI